MTSCQFGSWTQYPVVDKNFFGVLEIPRHAFLFAARGVRDYR